MWRFRAPDVTPVGMWMYADILQSQVDKCSSSLPPAYMLEWRKSIRGRGWGYSSQYCLQIWEARSWLSVHCWQTGTLLVEDVQWGILFMNRNNKLAVHTGTQVSPINKEGRYIVTCSTKPFTHFKSTCTKNYTDTHRRVHIKLVKPQQDLWIVSLSISWFWYWIIVMKDVTTGRNWVKSTWGLPVYFLQPLMNL